MRRNRHRDDRRLVPRWDYANDNKQILALRYDFDMDLIDIQKEEVGLRELVEVGISGL